MCAVTKKFPLLEGIMLSIHWAAWLAIVVTLWVTSPRGRAAEVLFTFTNGGGWPSPGAATLVGILTAWSVFVGYDSSVHMTENAKDASKTIPVSLMTAFGTNAFLAFIMAITLIFCVDDVNAVTAETSLTPFVVIFYNSTKSKAGTVVMVLPVIITFWSALVSQLATASRQLWAFARDGGMPWSAYLAPVSRCKTFPDDRRSLTLSR
jgi:choline transport protein